MSLVMSNQQKKVQIPQQWEVNLERLAEICLKEENIDPDAEISLVFVDDEEIRKLNNEYRGKDVPTDVLSFSMLESIEGEMEIIGDEEIILLGDIIISLETALLQAKRYGHSLDREVAYLMIHGLLHLIGYDHLTEEDKNNMRKREEKFLAEIGLNM